jgi:hypothetical protein
VVSVCAPLPVSTITSSVSRCARLISVRETVIEGTPGLRVCVPKICTDPAFDLLGLAHWPYSGDRCGILADIRNDGTTDLGLSVRNNIGTYLGVKSAL